VKKFQTKKSSNSAPIRPGTEDLSETSLSNS
jgi:hypothetical protein